jgi:TonB family protein
VKENALKAARISLLAAGLMTSVLPTAFAGDIKLIVNSSVRADTISGGELKRVFLEESNSLGDGTHVEPVLEKDGAVHQAFLREFLGRTDDDLQTYYRVLVFTGRGSMPRTFSSDAEIVAYVARTRSAIGYVSTATSTDGVKTLIIIDARNRPERKLILRVEPDYPETLKRLNIRGIVRLQITIAAKGNVENVSMLGGNPILGESAVAAVKQWIYAASHSRTFAEVSIAFDSHP